MRQVPGSSPGSGGRAARAFFLHPPFLPPSGDSFFRTFPTNPAKVLGLYGLNGEYYGNDLFCLRSRMSEVNTLYWGIQTTSVTSIDPHPVTLQESHFQFPQIWRKYSATNIGHITIHLFIPEACKRSCEGGVIKSIIWFAVALTSKSSDRGCQ